MRRDQIGKAARRHHWGLDSQLAADRSDDAVDLAREAVHETGLERGRRRLADHARRLDEVDLDEACGPLEKRLHGDLYSRREYAADVLALCGDDVEVGRGPEVDDDARRSIALLGGDRVRDPVRPYLSRVVVANRDPGAYPGAEDEQGRLRPALREQLVLANQRGHRRGQADAVDRLEVDEATDERAQLVARPVGLGSHAPVLAQA